MDAEQLTKLDLFKDLSAESRAEIAAEMKQIVVKPDCKIVKVGDVAREIFFVLSGTVRIVNAEGRDIGEQHAGTFFGELGIIFRVPRTVSVVAVDEVHLCVLQKADFNALCDKYPEIATIINKKAAERFSHFQYQLSRLAPHQVSVESPSSYTEEQLNSFREIFYAHSDGKGHINVAQLGKLLNKVINTGYEVTEQEARDFMKKLDKDGDGAIDFIEFVGGLKHLSWIAGTPGEVPVQNNYLPYVAAVAVFAAVAIGLWKYRK